MFEAIHSEFGIKNSISVALDVSFQFPEKEEWFADPNYITNKGNFEDIRKIPVKFRKGSDKIINFKETEYIISPHFYIPNKEKNKVCTIAESKEHKIAKNFIWNKIIQKELTFIYSIVKKPFTYKNKLLFNEIEFDFDKLALEVNVNNGNTKIADILLPFKMFNNLFGCGIVLEIQFSKQNEKITNERSFYWASRGYSVCWIYKDDFEELEQNHIQLKENEIKLNTNAVILNEFLNNKEIDFKTTIEEEARKLDEKQQTILDMKNDLLFHCVDVKELYNELSVVKIMNEYNKHKMKVCFNCKYSQQLVEKEGYFYDDEVKRSFCNCWYKYKNGTGKRPDIKNVMEVCDKWEQN